MIDRAASAGSAAGHAHMAADAWAVVAAIDDEVMALRLQADGTVDRGREQLVTRGGAQGFAQVRGILLAEAGVQRAGAGDPHPVAGFAKIMRHRRDETERARGLADADVARGSPRVVGE